MIIRMLKESDTVGCGCVSFGFWFSLTMYQGLGWMMMVLAATRLVSVWWFLLFF